MSRREEPAAGRYRRGVGAVLFNRAGEVFVGRRNDVPFEAWQLPQGGLDTGEDPERAMLRELKEETGTDNVAVLARTKHWLRYELPPELAAQAWKGRYIGQEQLWFALRFLGTDDEFDLDACDEPEFVAWRWVPFAVVPDLAVAFKRRLYEQLVAEFGSLARP